MHILLIAPYSDLDYARAERSNWLAANNLTVSESPSPVTIVSVTRALQAAEYDGLVIIGHGRADGILLDKGELLDYGSLAALIRGRMAWLYLGTCESERLAEAIAADSGVAVICTIGPIDDRHAYTIGSMVCFYLDLGHTFDEAAQLALPCPDPVTKRWSGGIRGFKYIAAPEAALSSSFRRRIWTAS
jgi:hypothetical protein